MQIEIPKEERENLKKEIPSVFAPEYELFIFDEALFEGSQAANDPALSDRDKSWYLNAIKAPQAWNITRGSEKITVAIVDNGFNLKHPELASKVVSPYNVWKHSAEIFPQKIDHGTHVAGIAAGNTQGWAREANIYNLIVGLNLPIVPADPSIPVDPDTTVDEFYTPSNLLFNYIREFHNTKPINTETGRRNPTIVNNSWGIGKDLFNLRNPYTGTLGYDFSKINFRDDPITPTGTPIDTGISGVFTDEVKMLVVPASGL
jgi:subtilisin family serine protease